MSRKKVSYYIGFDLSTQTLKVVFIDQFGKILAMGSFPINMIYGKNGEREGKPSEWKMSLKKAMEKARANAAEKGIVLGKCLGICPSGMMHGEGLLLDDGTFYDLVRLWCDGRNAEEARFLTELFKWNTPQRWTISRWYWTVLNRPELARHVVGVTTPAGVIAYYLGAKKLSLGFGEAGGMLNINPKTGYYDQKMTEQFDDLVKGKGARPIQELLPVPVMVGSAIGYVDAEGAELSGLDVGTPIISPEGDVPTTLAGTFCHKEEDTSMVCGTSFCHISITEKIFSDYRHTGAEPITTADGKRGILVHTQNGTSFMNLIVKKLFGALVGDRDPFDVVRPMATTAPVDCGGIIGLALAEQEHCFHYTKLPRAGFFNLNADNATPGNMVRASFVGSLFNTRWSVKDMEGEGIRAKEIFGSGGIGKSPWTYSAIAGVLNKPVRVLPDSDLCSPYGAALMAMFSNEKGSWGEFLDRMRPQDSQVIQPDSKDVATCDKMFEIFSGLVKKGGVEDGLIQLPWPKEEKK